MSITNHTKTTSVQPNGQISLTLMMFDQDQRSYERVVELPAGTDVDAWIATEIEQRNEQLAQDEFMSILANG